MALCSCLPLLHGLLRWTSLPAKAKTPWLGTTSVERAEQLPEVAAARRSSPAQRTAAAPVERSVLGRVKGTSASRN